KTHGKIPFALGSFNFSRPARTFGPDVPNDSPLFRPNRLVHVLCVLLARMSQTAWDIYLLTARNGLTCAKPADPRPAHTFVPTIPNR
ncbi:hypothetical protein KI387_009878, partial [Taxus chinensis]